MDQKGKEPEGVLQKTNEKMEYREVEEALWNSEARYKTLVNNLPQKVFVKDLDCRWVSVNRTMAVDLGIEPDECAGKTDYDFFPKELADKYHADDLRILENGKTETLEEQYLENGEDRFVQTIKTPIRSESGTIIGILGIFWDITEQKKLEDEIRQHRDELERMVEERSVELTRQSRILQQQAQDIIEISTPVMSVIEGVLVAPLIGTMDSSRTSQFMDKLLQRIVETNSAVVLVDITGVPTIDTQTAQHLIDTISAVKLLGARVIMTGVSPAIAQTLVHLGVDLSSVATRSSLSSGLILALDMMHMELVSKDR